MLVATISLVQARHGDLIHEVKQRALAKEFEVSEPSLLVVIFSLVCRSELRHGRCLLLVFNVAGVRVRL